MRLVSDVLRARAASWVAVRWELPQRHSCCRLASSGRRISAPSTRFMLVASRTVRLEQYLVRSCSAAEETFGQPHSDNLEMRGAALPMRATMLESVMGVSVDKRG